MTYVCHDMRSNLPIARLRDVRPCRGASVVDRARSPADTYGADDEAALIKDGDSPTENDIPTASVGLQAVQIASWGSQLRQLGRGRAVRDSGVGLINRQDLSRDLSTIHSLECNEVSARINNGCRDLYAARAGMRETHIDDPVGVVSSNTAAGGAAWGAQLSFSRSGSISPDASTAPARPSVSGLRRPITVATIAATTIAATIR